MESALYSNIKYLKTPPSWEDCFYQIYKLKEFKNLQTFLDDEVEKYVPELNIFPPPNLLYNSFNKCDFGNLKVCILGQDPYHSYGQAMGLSFSVPFKCKIPPSLKNIYKELKNDINMETPNHGDLTTWATQGVLLLNTSLTVREHCANSHSKYWKKITDTIIKYISDNKKNVIFMLWGRHARLKSYLIDINKHTILECGHPSPLSVRHYSGCKHFSKTNFILDSWGLHTINWNSLNSVGFEGAPLPANKKGNYTVTFN